MIVVVTGMVGLDKKSYLEGVCQVAARRNRPMTLCNVGDRMYAEARDVPASKILDVPIQRLNSLRRSVFKDILAKAEQTPDLIVNTHATFRWRHGLFPAVDFDQMRQLKADMYVCLIDGIAALHHRLLAEHTAEHTLKDLIVWREEEIIGTEMLRKGIDERVPLFCLARGTAPPTTETFYRLVFEPQVRKAYLSFPMTAVAGLDGVQRQIALFRQRMKSLFVCFDPGDLEESDLPRRARLAQARGLDHVPVDIGGQGVRLSARQILEIERDINSQTYARDFMLIDQSDMIVSFIPPLPDGRAAISSGVERELQHAHEAAKEVYVIWPAAQAPSVFVTQTATAVFRTIDEATRTFSKTGCTAP
ncbi:MAG: AAA family ATPase [Phycisphaerae bacterium]|nr:AAA family ATPase [Phycisphaerae bacterium]